MLPDRAIAFILILLLTLGGLLWGLRSTRRVIEAPFLYATGMSLILCPQLFVIAGDRMRVPDEAFWVFCTMVVLCSLALYAGYFSSHTSRCSKWRKTVVRSMVPGRLYLLGVLVASAGTFGAYKLAGLGTVTDLRGWPVYWTTLQSLIMPGIVLMLVAYAHAPTARRLVPLVLFSVVPLSWITETGRRSAALTLPIIYTLPFLIRNRRLRIPRGLIVLCLAGAFVVVYAFPVWRDRFKDHHYLQVIEDHPLSDVIGSMFSGDTTKSAEIADGMIVTGARYELSNYEWGVVGLYNLLIESYVPGGLLGRDFKESLRIGHGVNHDWVSEVDGIPVAVYTAKSGYEDLFSQFSFLGCVALFFVGRGFRKVHEAAVDQKDGRAEIFLCLFISFPASIAYGSLLYGIVMSLPQLIILFLAFRFCFVRSGRTLRSPRYFQTRHRMTAIHAHDYTRL